MTDESNEHQPTSRGTAGSTELPVILTVDGWIAYLEASGAGDLQVDDLEWMLSRIGGENGPSLIWGIYVLDRLTPDLGLLVGQVWASAEFPDRALEHWQWTELFDVAGYVEDGIDTARPREPLQLWRGSVEARKSDWSWTDDRGVAERYATAGIRGRPRGRVWTALVEPHQFLCRNTARDEAEYVVDTARLQIVEELGQG